MFSSSLLLLALSPLSALAHSGSGSGHHNLAPRGHGKSKPHGHSGGSGSGSNSTAPPATSTSVEALDDADTSSISYTGDWTHGTVNGGTTLSWTDAAAASYNFTTPKGATGVTIKSTLKSDRGAFKVLMDGEVVGNGTTHSGAASGNSTKLGKDEAETASQVVFTAKITRNATHTWKVVKTSPAGTYLSLDEIEIAGVQTSVSTGSTKGYFYGANNYFLYSMDTDARHQLLDQMKAAGMSVARIFLTHVGAGSKGSASIDVPDVEPSQVGQYDDTILHSIDQLMADASQRGIKLIIALHDRYALGFWGTDAYAYKFGVVSGGSGAQEVADASSFYTSSSAAAAMDARYTHIMNHKNSLMGNKAWKDLPEALFAVEPENEPMGHMSLVDPNWVCDRAGTLKKLIGGSGVLVASGGGITLDDSLQSWATDCANLDIISVHDYGTDASSTVGALSAAKKKYEPQGKVVMFEEFGAKGSGKTQQVQQFVSALKAAQVPWSYWELTNPGQGDNDFEVWTDEGAWKFGLMEGGHAPKSSKREAAPEGDLVASSRRSSGKYVRRSQASRRNSRPVERVP